MHKQPLTYLAVLTTGLVVLLATVFVQFAAGVASRVEEIPAPDKTFPPELIATNEAMTWAIETAEAEQMMRAEQTAIAANATKPPYEEPSIPPTRIYDPNFDGNVSVGYDPPAGNYGYHWENSWDSMMADGTYIEVVAGAIRGDLDRDNIVPNIAVLRVTTENNRALNGEYRLPDGNGTLRIVAAKRTCLDLVVIETGRKLQFDVAIRLWSCSAGK